MFKFENWETSKLEERRAQIATEAEAEGADTDALLKEARAINDELEKRAAKAKAQEEIRAMVAGGKGNVVEHAEAAPAQEDVRSSEAYLNAYADFLKTGDDSECRSLLSENGSGTIAVPTYVAERIKTAWEKNKLASRIRKISVPGNFKQGFEISSSNAASHTEGSSDVSEGTITNGIVSLIPEFKMKWITVSKEAIKLTGQDLIDYLFSGLEDKIVKKIVNDLLTAIIACGTVGTTTQVAVPVYTSTTLTIGLVAKALGELSDEADDPVVVCNKKTWAALKEVQATNKYGYDPFEKLDVIFNNSLPAFSAATTGDTYMIVGDFGEGALANFPDGEAIEFIYDTTTLATTAMVKVTGQEYCAVQPVAMNAFVKVIA